MRTKKQEKEEKNKIQTEDVKERSKYKLKEY
jgi:hypothetical protein